MFRQGDKIGPYTLVNQLGRGAFGVVWLAERRGAITTTTVALKLTLDENPDLNSIKQEADVWVKAGGHPNVLSIIEADVYDSQIVIVSEYAPDGSLEERIKRYGGKAPSIEAAVSIVSGILAGLEHLHARRIIHRDLKPANILLQGEIPRLADFGIARVLKTSAHSGVISGTPVYMAPEAFDGQRSVQTDLWAVGVMFYQLMTGRLPFSRTDTGALMKAIIMDDPDPLPPSIPLSLQEVVIRSLQKDPLQRYKSATDMLAALRISFIGTAGLDNLPTEHISNCEQIPLPVEKLTVQPNPQMQISNKQQSDSYQLPKFNTGARMDLAYTPSPISNTPFRSELLRKLHWKHYMSFVAVLLILASILFTLHNIGKNEGKTPSTSQSSSKTRTEKIFEFDVVTINAERLITDRRRKQAQYFTEDLGGGVTMDMVKIQGGTFVMGSPGYEYKRDRHEGPQHYVTVREFYIGKFEVTQAQWNAVMGNNLSYYKGDSLPVDSVSWNDAVEFCRLLSQKTGQQYRLPTEAEWEYSCRAGTTTPFAFGETITPELVNYNGDRSIFEGAPKGVSREGTIPVGSLGIANAFGLYDMHGNVLEWCLDVYHDIYANAPTDGSAWVTGGDASYRVLRGGSWHLFGIDSRSAFRTILSPNGKSASVGFRIVKVSTGVTQ